MVTCVTGDICKEVIENLALDDMWEAAKLDEDYQSVAETNKQNMDKEVYKTVTTTASKEYIRLGVERMSVIEKGNTIIVLIDQIRNVVPQTMWRKLLDTEREKVPPADGPFLRPANVCSTDTAHTVSQLERWFATFGVSWSIRCDNGPRFSSKGFKEFCDEYCIKLNLTSPYNPGSSGATERGVGFDPA